MNGRPICILNLDDSLVRQQKLLSRYNPDILDLKDLGPKARFWMDKGTREAIEERIGGLARGSITFLGSGDFHHISNILVNQIEGEFALIVFDFHPDWFTLPPNMACGSWVAQSLKNKNILRLLVIGASSEDISTWNIQSGDLSSFKDNRLQIYPYHHAPSRVIFKKIPQNASFKVKKGFFHSKIYWDELRGKNLTGFFSALIRELPTKRVYVSIDKDCLKKEYSLTNWEEGELSLDELLGMLKLIKENLDIVGLDIVGDYSEIAIASRFKSFFSKLDHPKEAPAAKFTEQEISATNEETNLKILELFNSR